MKPYFFIIAAVLALSGMGCQSGAKNTQAGTEPPADFMAFYQQFHEDSVYQMEHIQWPLPGQTDVQQAGEAAAVTTLMEWTPDTWKMHQRVDFAVNTDLKQAFEVIGDAMVIERVQYVNAEYGQERRFFKEENGQWQLIYYADVMRMVK